MTKVASWDSWFSVQWHTEYLTNVHWYLGTIYDNLFSDIFHHHSEPFVKMWNESMVHICVSRIDWVDYFTILGKYIDAEKNSIILGHTRDTFTPIAENGQFRPVGSGRVGGQVDHDL